MTTTNWLTRFTPPRGALALDDGTGAAPPRAYPLDAQPSGARAVLAMLRYRAAIVAGGLALGLGAAAYFAYRDQPVYRATTVVRLTDVRSAVVRGLEGDESERAARRSDPLLTRLELLKSRALVGGVVDDLGLRLRLPAARTPAVRLANVRANAAAPHDTIRLTFGDSAVTARNQAGDSGSAAYGRVLRVGAVGFTVAGPPGARTASLVVIPREAAIDSVLKNLRAIPRAETDVVDVSFISPDARIAQDVANGLSAAFRRVDVQEAQEQSRRRRVFLEGQLRETDAALVQAQRALDSYRRGQPAYNSREQMAAQQSALVALDIRREEIDADRRMTQGLLTRLEQHGPADGARDFQALVASPDVSGNPVVSQLLQRVMQYQTARDSLTTGEWRNSAKSPEVARLDELLAAAKAQVVGAVRSQLTALDARAASLTGLRARMAASAVLPSQESREARLAEQAAASRQISDEIRREYQKARMAEAAEIGQVQVLDWAAAPERPMRSLRSMKLGLGLLLGLLLGAGGATLREAADGSVRRREQVEGQLELPVLAIVPRITTGDRARPPELSGLSAANPVVADGGGRFARVRNAQVVAHAFARRWTGPKYERNRLAAREAQRMLRNNLTWATGANGAPNVIVVTSAMAGEGKTTTAVNLALGYVRESKRTLLIDCDFRRPRLHDLFRTAQSPGLGQYLLGHAPLASVIRSPHLAGLSIVPAGQLPADAHDALDADRFRDALRELSGRYERIVIDTPPVLAVADAAMLAAAGDGVVLVVRAGTTERLAVEQSLRQLAFVGARVLGVVLNDAGGELERYGRYSPVGRYDATESA
jgi:capsular exopolysaccharide synthesis family protein